MHTEQSRYPIPELEDQVWLEEASSHHIAACGIFLLQALIAVQWLYFWFSDLSSAHIQVLCWVVPLMGVLAVVIRRAMRRMPQPALAFWGGMAALCVVSFLFGYDAMWLLRRKLSLSSTTALRPWEYYAWLPLLGCLVFAVSLFFTKARKAPSWPGASPGWLGAFQVGLWFGWAAVWFVFLNRADNGCTGVSQTYGNTLAVTCLELMGWAGLALWHWLRRD